MTANCTCRSESSRAESRIGKAFGEFVYSRKRAAARRSSASGERNTRASKGIEVWGSRLDIANTKFNFGQDLDLADGANKSSYAIGRTLRSFQCKRAPTMHILSVSSDLTAGRLRTAGRNGATSESWSHCRTNNADCFSSGVESVQSNSNTRCRTTW